MLDLVARPVWSSRTPRGKPPPFARGGFFVFWLDIRYGHERFIAFDKCLVLMRLVADIFVDDYRVS